MLKAGYHKRGSEGRMLQPHLYRCMPSWLAGWLAVKWTVGRRCGSAGRRLEAATEFWR